MARLLSSQEAQDERYHDAARDLRSARQTQAHQLRIYVREDTRAGIILKYLQDGEYEEIYESALWGLQDIAEGKATEELKGLAAHVYKKENGGKNLKSSGRKKQKYIAEISDLCGTMYSGIGEINDPVRRAAAFMESEREECMRLSIENKRR